MASQVEDYKTGVEKRVVEGEEQYAIWVPMSAAESEELLEKAKATNVNVRYLVANLLRGWMAATQATELSVADLDRVVGGAGVQLNTLNIAQVTNQSLVNPVVVPNLGSFSTVMCPW